MQTEVLQTKLELLRSFLETYGHIEQINENAYMLAYGFGATPVGCLAEIDPIHEAFLFQVLNTITVEPQYRSLVLGYMNYVNYPLPIGNWEMYLDNGIVRWRSGIYFGGSDLSESMIKNVINSCLYFVGETLSGILILQRGGTMEEAIDSIGPALGLGRA